MASSAPECPAFFYYGAPDENCSHFAPYVRLTRENGKTQMYCDKPGGCDACKYALRFHNDPKCYGCQRKKMFERAHASFFDETTSVPVGQLKPFTARSSRLYRELVDDICAHEDFWKGEDDARARFSGTVLYSLAVELSRLAEEHQRYDNLEEADRVWGLAFYFLRRQNALAEKMGDAKAIASGREMVYNFYQKELGLAVDMDDTKRVADTLHTLSGIEREKNMPLEERTYSKMLNIRLQEFNGRDATHDMAGDTCLKWETIMTLLHQGGGERVKGPAAKEEDRKSMCGVCGIKAEQKKLMRCSKCHSIWYCRRECQALDWKDHKAECKLAQLKVAA